MRISAIILAACLMAMSASPALAGAWTQGEGETLLITTARLGKADEGYDAYGFRSQSRDFEKREVEAYLEYGLRNSLTLVFAPSYQSVDDSSRHESGLAYADLGLRVRLYDGKFGVISVQPLLILPGTTSGSDNPLTGSGRLEEEARLLVGNDFTLFGLHGFQNVEAAYRYRGAERSQLRSDVTVGVDLGPRVQVFAKSFTILGQDDFLMQKVQGSLSYALTPRWTVEGGYGITVAGRNVVAERTSFLALWFKY